jgi:outer membrane lipoprotein-sorting protein
MPRLTPYINIETYCMPLLRFALLPLLLLTTCSAADLPQTLAAIDKSAESFHAISTEFNRINHNGVLNVDEVDNGTLLVKKLKSKDFSALIVFKGSNSDRLSLSGRKARRYEVKLNTVEEYDLDRKFGGAVIQYLLLGFGNSSRELQEGYAIAMGGLDTVGGQKATRLELTPRKPDAMGFKRMDLWVSDATGMNLQVKLFSSGGDYWLITYSNTKMLPNIPDSDLDIKAPKNAKVTHPLK